MLSARPDSSLGRPAGGPPKHRHRGTEPCAPENTGAQAPVAGCKPCLLSAQGKGVELSGSPEALSSAGRRVALPVCIPGAAPAPPQAAGPTHLDAVLLQVQVPRVDRDAGWDLGQLSPRADHPAGLVAAGAGRGAGGGWRGAPSGSRRQGHAAPAGPQGWGEEPEEEQGPVGPGHPTGQRWGARGAVGARHPQRSCSTRAPGGYWERDRERLNEGQGPCVAHLLPS